MGKEAAKKIAVVNDVTIHLTMAQKILGKEGYEVFSYKSASSALKDITDKGKDNKPDLIITDLHMPGIDGWKFCRLLRSAEYPDFNDIPVLVCSATFNGTDVEYITKDIGANAFLPVPYEAIVLKDFVRELLEGKEPKLMPRVLIVDDVEYLALHLKKVFVKNGYEVDVAVDGNSARKMFMQRRPEVTILDYHLPDCNGDELLMEFKETEHPPVCIILTGDTTPELALELMQKGADAYVQKPANRDYLLQVVQKAQRQRSLLGVESLLERKVQELGQAERKNLKNKEILEKAQRLAHFGSFECDFRLDRVIMTEELCVIYGVESDGDGAVLNVKESMSLIHAEDREKVRQIVTESKDPETTISIEYRIVRPKDGEIRHVQGENRITRNNHGVPMTMLGTLLDVTEKRMAEKKRRKMEKRLMEVHRLESLADMAGGIAHDFNNLLSGIIGNVGLAMVDVPLNSPAFDCMKDVEHSAHLASELSQQMLAYSGKGHFIFRPVNLSEMVRNSNKLLLSSIQHQIKLEYHLKKNLPKIKVDETQFRQLMVSLCINASEAIGEIDGHIVVSTGIEFLDEQSIKKIIQGENLKPGEYVYFEIQDNGIGMSPDLVGKIFDPFFSTKFTGRGLGLAAVWGIVMGHKGGIYLETSSDCGTTFRVYFPSYVPSEETVERSTSEGLAMQNKIVVIDDEPIVLKMAKKALERAEYEVETFESGYDALDYFRENSKDVLLILLDLSMPGISGDEILTHLKEVNPDVRVIMSSGYSINNIAEKYSGNTGPAEFLQKPYSPQELIDKIKKVTISSDSL